MTGRKFWTFSLVLVLCVIVTAGCSRRRSSRTTIVSGSDIFTTDEFPGDDVQSGNVADDKRAMSVSGDDFSYGLNYFANGDRGQGVVTYKTSSGQLYAHYFNGAWTPPIALRAIDSISSSSSSYTVVAFVNPVDGGDEFAGDRAGDAYIFWTADDTDDDGGGSDGSNEVLFATFVDSSAVGEIGQNYGFQEFATRISDQDESGEDIQTIGLVSDGLCGEARWEDGDNNYRWGNDTTAIILFWNQYENDGAGSWDYTTYAVRFNPSEATDASLPLTPSGDTRLDIQEFGASDSATDADETRVNGLYASYNEFLFCRVSANITGGPGFNWGIPFAGDDDDDETIQYNRFDLAAGTVSGAVSLNPGATDATDLDDNTQLFLAPNSDNSTCRSIYGPDEGVGVIVIYTVANVEDVDGDATDSTDNVGLLLAEINPFTGALITNTFVDAEDATVSDYVMHSRVDTRISRNGDYIVAAWMERDDAGSDDYGMWVSVYHTSRPDGDGVTTLLAIADSLSPAILTTPDQDGYDIDAIMFQDGLGYICGGQSDPDVMHLFYEMPNTTSGSSIYLVRLVVDPATETESTTTSLYESFIEWEQGWDRVHTDAEDFNATDAGNDGGLIVAYRQDITSVDDDDRIFCERTGTGAGFSEIDSAVTWRQATGNAEIVMVGTPPGSDIGEYDDVDLSDSDARPHGFTNVHVIFREDESQEDAGFGNALRTRQYRNDDSLAFLDAFTPSIAGGTFQFPFDLDLPFVDPSTGDDADIVGAGVSGDVVGIWFTELQHLYYQEFNGNNGEEVGWLNDEGQSNPFLVDDDNDEELYSFIESAEPSCTCNTLDGFITFWTKSYGSGGGQTERLQVRVRTGSSND